MGQECIKHNEAVIPGEVNVIPYGTKISRGKNFEITVQPNHEYYYYYAFRMKISRAKFLCISVQPNHENNSALKNFVPYSRWTIHF